MSVNHPIARRSFLAVPLAAAAAVGVASCGFDDDSSDTGDNDTQPNDNTQPSGDGDKSGGKSSGAPVSGKGTDTFREAHRPVNHLNPALKGGGSPQSTLLMAMMWEGLIRRDPKDTANYLPGMAEKWEVSEDGKTLTFHLRDGLKWSNGDPLTAGDMVWTYSYYYSPDLANQGSKYDPQHTTTEKSNVLKGLLDYYAGKTKDIGDVGIKAPDDKTLVYTLTDASYKFLDSLVAMYPLHKKSVEANQKDFWLPKNFVGNGPYNLTKYKQNGSALMELNENYWDAGSFGIKKREIQFNSAGATGMMVSYNSNEIDLFRVDGDPTALIAGRKDVAKELQHASLTQYKGLGPMPNKNPILQENIKLRQALAMAIDREAVAKVAPPDVAGPSWVPSGVAGADKLPKIPFDVKKAQSLMEEAGFPGGKGVPGLKILTYAKMPMLEAVASMWKKNLGISTSVAVKEVGVYSDLEHGNLPDDFVGYAFNYIAPRPFNIMSYGSTATFSDKVIPYDVWHGQIYQLQYGKEKNKYSSAQRNAKILELRLKHMPEDYKKYYNLTQKATELDHQGKTDEAIATATEAAAAFQETYYYIPLLWAGYTFMVKPRVHDLVLTSYPYDMYTMKGVSLDPVKS